MKSFETATTPAGVEKTGIAVDWVVVLAAIAGLGLAWLASISSEPDAAARVVPDASVASQN